MRFVRRALWWAADYLYAARRQLAVLSLPWAIGRPRPVPASWRRGDPSLPELFLLPGVYEHWTFLRPLGDALAAAGHRVQVIHGLGVNRRSITGTAERLMRVLSETPAPPAGRVLVGHSKGGLIGKHALIASGAAAAPGAGAAATPGTTTAAGLDARSVPGATAAPDADAAAPDAVPTSGSEIAAATAEPASDATAPEATAAAGMDATAAAAPDATVAPDADAVPTSGSEIVAATAGTIAEPASDATAPASGATAEPALDAAVPPASGSEIVDVEASAIPRTGGRPLGLLGLVAVATPFAGARRARLLLADPSIRAFLPDDATIVTLGRETSINGRIVSVFGPYDPHIPEGSALDGATNIEVPAPGHFRLLGSPATHRAVLDGITRLAHPEVP